MIGYVRPANRMSRLRKIKCVAGVLLVALLTVVIGAVAYQLIRVRLADSLLHKIDLLVLRPPDDMTELEWAMLVYYTHNLHGSAIPQQEMSIAELRSLHRDLDSMLESGPNRNSIDYLWDEYARLTEGGAWYRELYESDRDARIAAALRGGEAYFDRSSYTDFIEYVASRQNQ